MPIEYFGNEQAVSMSKQFISKFGQKNEKRAMIYFGLPGTGKTYLTEYLEQAYRVERILINASERRTSKSVGDIIRLIKNRGRMIVVLDECEAMSSKNLEKIIKATEIPLFLCCNYIDMIDREVTDLCIICKIDPPQWWTFRQYMEATMKQCGIAIPSDLEARAKKARSFRHAMRLIDDPDDLAPEPIETEYTQVRKILCGITFEHIAMKPGDLLTWINDNANVPELASNVDILINRGNRDDYHHWAYAYSALQTVRSDNKVEYPRSIRLMSKAKKQHEEQSRVDRDAALSNIKIDFSKVDATVVKSGASLFEGLDELNLDDIK